MLKKTLELKGIEEGQEFSEFSLRRAAARRDLKAPVTQKMNKNGQKKRKVQLQKEILAFKFKKKKKKTGEKTLRICSVAACFTALQKLTACLCKCDSEVGSQKKSRYLHRKWLQNGASKG